MAGDLDPRARGGLQFQDLADLQGSDVGERHLAALWLLGQERAYGSVTIGG